MQLENLDMKVLVKGTHKADCKSLCRTMSCDNFELIDFISTLSFLNVVSLSPGFNRMSPNSSCVYIRIVHFFE